MKKKIQQMKAWLKKTINKLFYKLGYIPLSKEFKPMVKNLYDNTLKITIKREFDTVNPHTINKLLTNEIGVEVMEHAEITKKIGAKGIEYTCTVYVQSNK